MGIKFQVTDAHKAMKDLTQEQAIKWVKWANQHYERLKMLDGRERYCRRRATEIANKEVIRRYGPNRAR